MRKIIFLLVTFSFAACNSGTKETKVESMSAAEPTKTDTVTYAYKPEYSSKFEIGDPKNAQTILSLWKDWDQGNLSNSKDKFADSVEMHLSNGMILKGSRDSVIKSSQDFRNTMSTVNSTVDAFFPVKSTDKNENWACVWGKEISTDKKGKTDSVYLQETWRFNAAGKLDFMIQYARAATAPKS